MSIEKALDTCLNITTARAAEILSAGVRAELVAVIRKELMIVATKVVNDAAHEIADKLSVAISAVRYDRENKTELTLNINLAEIKL